MADVVFKIRDFSDEYSTVRIPIADFAADGSDYQARMTQVGSLQAAIAAVTAGTIAPRTVPAERGIVNDTRPASPFAQRELKWLIQYQDDVSGKHYTLSIPAPALELMSDGGDDVADIVGITAWSTLVTWLEANMTSPEGNSITVNRVSVVGRNT